jgi:glycerate kinase
MRIVAAPDKFRGTASAPEVAAAIGRAAWDTGHDCDEVPVADGGEGTLDAFGGPNRTDEVTGPLGDTVEAAWRLDGRLAVIEAAQACGLLLAGGPEGNDPLAATSRGVGELIRAAIDHGARRIVVGVGGTACTDGGLGALEALNAARLRGIDLLVACDVHIPFTAAAPVFAPQKGASPAQVELLRRRLERLAGMYQSEHGIDVADLPGSGAAGGLAGGLAAVGAQLEPGFELVAEEVLLLDRLEGADLVITGEGELDEESFDGKVVGGVLGMAADLGVPALVVVGRRHVTEDVGAPVLSLVDRFGVDAAMERTARCVEDAVRGWLRG